MGAIGAVAPGATAFVHRRALASVQYIADFGPRAAAAEVGAAGRWLSTWYASLRPYVSGEAYQNYIDPELAGWAHAYYGANLGRLRQVKATWDPDGIWRFAQAIPPPGPGRS